MSKIFIILSFLAISSSQIELESSSITYYGSHPFHDWQGVSNSANYQINCSESNTCKISISIPVESFDSKNEIDLGTVLISWNSVLSVVA